MVASRYWLKRPLRDCDESEWKTPTSTFVREILSKALSYLWFRSITSRFILPIVESLNNHIKSRPSEENDWRRSRLEDDSELRCRDVITFHSPIPRQFTSLLSSETPINNATVMKRQLRAMTELEAFSAARFVNFSDEVVDLLHVLNPLLCSQPYFCSRQLNEPPILALKPNNCFSEARRRNCFVTQSMCRAILRFEFSTAQPLVFRGT